MSRKKKHEEHESHERWLVSYADFITLLFAFFVVMYATSSNNEEKQKKFEDSVRAELKLGMVGSGSRSAGESGGESLLPDLLEGFPKRGGPTEAEDYLVRQLKKKMTKEEFEKSVTLVRHDSIGARISLASSSFFPSGEAKLKYSSLKTLDHVASLLKETDRRVVIEGHSDNVPVRSGPFESNWELSSLRATSVVRYLVKYHGIDPARLSAVSYADQKPLAPNDSEENRARNRRIEILIVMKDPAGEE